MAARKAVALHERYALYRVNLSEVLERQGRFGEALDCGMSAVEMDPETPLW